MATTTKTTKKIAPGSVGKQGGEKNQSGQDFEPVKQGVAPGSIGAQAGKVFIPQSQQNLIDAGLSSATDVGITDINKIGKDNLTGVQKSTVKQQQAGVKAQDGSVSYQGGVKGKKILDKAIATTQQIASGAPKPSAPSEGETPEDAQARMLADAQAQADYYKAENERQAKEAATVSGQVTDLSVQLKAFQEQNQSAIASLNSAMGSLGDKSAAIAQEVINEGGTPNLQSQQIQDKIKSVGIQNIPEEQKSAQIKKILMDSGRSEKAAIARTDIAPKILPSAAGTGSPVQTEAQIQKSATTSFYQSPAPDFASLIDQLSKDGSNGSDFNTGDLALMQLKFSQGANQQVLDKLQQKYVERKNRIIQQQDFYTKYWETKKSEGAAFYNSIKDSALRRNDLREQQLLAQKDQKMAELAKKSERYESFVKAQMAAAGIPLEGQMGATMLINSMASWEDFVADQGMEYDEQIGQLHDKSIEIIDSFASKMFEFNSNIDDKLFAKQDELSEKFEENENDLTNSEIQTQLANISSINDYIKAKSDEKAAQQKAAMDSYNEMQKKLWDLQVDGIKAQGGIVTIGKDGMPTAMVNGNGEMIFNAEYARDQKKDSFEEQKYWAAQRELKVEWNEDLGEYIGTDKQGKIVNLGSASMNVPSDSLYDFFVKPNEISYNVPVGQPPSENRWQCGEFANDCLFGGPGRGGFGNDIEDDIRRLGNSKIPVAGGGFMERTGGTPGHKGLVEKVNDDGSFVILESNYTKNENGQGITERKLIIPGSERYKSIMSGAFYDPNPGGLKKEDSNTYSAFVQQGKDQGMSIKEAKKFASDMVKQSYGSMTDSQGAAFTALLTANNEQKNYQDIIKKYSDTKEFADKINIVSRALGNSTKPLTQETINRTTDDPDVRAAIMSEMRWVAAVLRKESGASISIQEYQNKGGQFFPRAGDDAKEIERKKQARELTERGLMGQAGPSGVRQFYEIQKEGQAPKIDLSSLLPENNVNTQNNSYSFNF